MYYLKGDPSLPLTLVLACMFLVPCISVQTQTFKKCLWTFVMTSFLCRPHWPWNHPKSFFLIHVKLIRWKNHEHLRSANNFIIYFFLSIEIPIFWRVRVCPIKHVFKGNDENFMCLRALNFLLPLNLFCAGKILLLNHRLCTDGLLNCITLLLHNDSAVIIRDVLWPVSQPYCGQ